MGRPTALRQAIDQAIGDILRRSDQSLKVDSKVLTTGLAAVRSNRALLGRQAGEDRRRRKPRFP
jgi:hypothetical protein